MAGPTREGFEAAWIEVGTVMSVNSNAHTVVWKSDESDSEVEDLAIGSPYIHQAYGEGCTFMPDVGAKAAVCTPSDDSPPFIICYITDPSAETKEGSAEVTFRSGRQRAAPGEMLIRGRKGNTFWLKRNGTIEMGASPGCSTFHFPVTNLIWHVCKAYRIDTAGGNLVWEIKSGAGSADATELKAVIKERNSATMASVMIRAGGLLDATPVPMGVGGVVFETIVAPEGITEKGVFGAHVFAFRIDRQGNTYKYTKGVVTKLIDGDLYDTATNRTTIIKGNDLTTITGNKTELITGMVDSTAMRQVIRAVAGVVLEALMVQLGSQGAVLPTVLGPTLVQALISHTHSMGPANPSQELSNLGASLSKGVFLDR